MPPSADYVVAVCKPDGQWEARERNTTAYAYMNTPINIALGMLSTPMAQQALTCLALELDTTIIPLELPVRRMDHNRAANGVRLFLLKLYDRFPVVVVNESLADGGALGYHERLGPDNSFDLRDHSIHVNAAVRAFKVDVEPLLSLLLLANQATGSEAQRSRYTASNGSADNVQKLAKMVTAYTHHHSTDFRTWQFIFAHIILHELTHLFVTFLGRTNPGTMTPPHIGCGIPGTYSDQSVKGESGRWLEFVLFGGTFEIFKDPDRRNGQTVDTWRRFRAE